MPYNKKNSGDRNNQGNSFDKKGGTGNSRPPGKNYKSGASEKKGAYHAPGSDRRNEGKPFVPRDKDELAPPRFLPPIGDKPYGKRNDSKAFNDRKRPSGPFVKGRDEHTRAPGFEKRESVNNKEWGKDDLAHPKYFQNSEKKSFDERPKKPAYDKAKPFRENSDERPVKSFNTDRAGNGYDRPAKSFSKDKPDSYDRPSKPFSREKPGPKRKDDFKHAGDFGDKKPFRPKYETEVSVKKPYRDKSVKTPNERKRELLGTVDEKTDIRLNKYIANSGICARREADELIKKGLVTVNGSVVTEMGHKVKKEDIVKYDGRRILPEPFVYVLMNKPKDFITTTDDEKGRKTVMDLLADKIPQRIYPIGRLDRNTTGVLLLTNDGEVAQALTHPAFEIKKVYHVVLDKKVSSADLDKLVEGIALEDGQVFADAVSFVDNEDKSHVGVEIHSGKNRVVRRMFEHLGYEVEKLDRVSVGVFTKKDLPRGKWRYLSQSEVGFLMKLKSKMP